MRTYSFMGEQMVKTRREAAVTLGADVAMTHHVSEHALYFWRERFETMGPLDTKRLEQLEVGMRLSRSCYRAGA